MGRKEGLGLELGEAQSAVCGAPGFRNGSSQSGMQMQMGVLESKAATGTERGGQRCGLSS